MKRYELNFQVALPKILEEKGHTIYSFSKITGGQVSAKIIYDLLNNRAKFPSLEKVILMAEFLDFTPWDFLKKIHSLSK